MANARDAHREVGKSDTAIEVTLPSKLKPELVVRDFGPGISPQRKHEVLVVYGGTTKAKSNNENGGFGIGAKCGFSYANAFSITTIHARTKYVYSAYIDEHRMNQLATMFEGPADPSEPDGTEIRLPVKEADINTICMWVAEVTEAWLPRPVFTGMEPVYRNPVPAYDIQGLAKIYKQMNYGTMTAMKQSGIIALLDDMPYVIPHEEMDTIGGKIKALHDAVKSAGLTMTVAFKVGELEPMQNRESLYFSDLTRSALADRFTLIFDAIQAYADAEVAKMTTIIDAISKYWSDEPMDSLANKIKVFNYAKAGFTNMVSVKCEDAGVVVWTARVESDKVTERKDRHEISLRELFRPGTNDPHSSKSITAVVDHTNGTPNFADIKRELRNIRSRGGYSYGYRTEAFVVDIVDQAKFNALIGGADINTVCKFDVISKPPKQPRKPREAVPDSYLVTSFDFKLCKATVNGVTEMTITHDHNTKRVFKQFIKDRIFFRGERDADKNVNATIYDTPVPWEDFKRAVMVWTTLHNALIDGLNYTANAYLALYADRYDDAFEDQGLEPRFLEDIIDEVKAALVIDTGAVTKLILKGYHLDKVTKAKRWAFDDDCRRSEETTCKLYVDALKASGKFSTTFFREFEVFFSSQIEEGSRSGGDIAYMSPYIDAAVGPEISARVSAVAEEIDMINIEFRHMFSYMPDLPYLLAALDNANNRDYDQRGVRDRAVELKTIIAERIKSSPYVPGLQFSAAAEPVITPPTQEA